MRLMVVKSKGFICLVRSEFQEYNLIFLIVDTLKNKLNQILLCSKVVQGISIFKPLFRAGPLLYWFDNFGVCRQRDPRVFLSLFDKLAPIKKEIEGKFAKVADDKKKATTALLAWSDVYCLGDLPDYFKAPKVHESFSHLLDCLVSNCRFVSISFGGDDQVRNFY